LDQFSGEKAEPYTGSQNLPRQVKSKVESMLIIFCDMKGIVHKAGPNSHPRNAVTFHGDCVKIVREDFAPNFGDE
jgi:hypothetical protein